MTNKNKNYNILYASSSLAIQSPVVFGFRGVGWEGRGLALLYFSYGHSFFFLFFLFLVILMQKV
jgi:hypothetical protein